MEFPGVLKKEHVEIPWEILRPETKTHGNST